MENDVLRNKIAPWQEKGRWYHARFVYNNGWDYDYDNSDPYFANKTVSSNYATLTDDHDYVPLTAHQILYNDGATGAAFNYSTGQFRRTAQRTVLVLQTSSTFYGTIDLYVFIVKLK